MFFNKIEKLIVEVCITHLVFGPKMSNTHLFNADNDIIRRAHKMETLQGITADGL